MKSPLLFSSLVTTCTLMGVLAAAGFTPAANLPHDPGPRGGTADAGGTFPTIDPNPTNDAADKAFFDDSQGVFEEVDTVTGGPNTGLGPTFNANSCAMCHAFPASGGSSPVMNPQVADNFAHLDGALNPADLSGILSLDGPVREVRFILNPDGTPDGGVHDLFTIAGRSDAPGSTIAQPNFDAALAAHNAIFRIPTPTFGLGLVESTPDATLETNLAATAFERAQLGIGGTFNKSGNDGTITRFGWKAQNKSLLMFSGEAYNVEMGVTNELFPNERFPAGTPAAVIANSTFNATPEDATNILFNGSTTGTASQMSSDIVNFAGFMRLLAPPAPVENPTASEVEGGKLFTQIGCSLCHSPTLKTAKSIFPALSNTTYHPYSDFAIHHMGPKLSDGISQGAAGPDQFRTAPLWGVGQRIFFLHDGRTNDLLQTIQDHASGGNWDRSGAPPSEANGVVRQFDELDTAQQQDILDFLRSL